jgi:hypothetical protein
VILLVDMHSTSFTSQAEVHLLPTPWQMHARWVC